MNLPRRKGLQKNSKNKKITLFSEWEKRLYRLEEHTYWLWLGLIILDLTIAYMIF